MNRKSAGAFPALYGPLIAREEGRDLLPGVEPAATRIAAVFGFHAPKNPFLTRCTLWARRVPGSTIPCCAAREELREFVRSHAWGHHASCSCAIGPRDQGGVLDSNFRVYGASGLRVVDASVFPRIPGFFIASAIYMVGEKAADVILESARRNQ